MPKPKAALIEIYDSHDVNLYSQLLFLKNGGYEPILIVSVAHKEQIEGYNLGQETLFTYCTGKKGLALWKELWRIRSLILDRGIDTVIFNTAHTNPVRNFCMLPFPKRIKFFGTLHGVNKLTGSLTQRIISRRINKYFLLNDYMLEKAMKVPHNGLSFSVFYPIFHPDFPAVKTPEKRESDIWISIPGQVEFKRRDYISLIESFSSIALKPPIRFIILGDGTHTHGNGKELNELVVKNQLQDYFQFFDGFVNNETFHTYIKASDAILPLTHPINAELQKYAENQISGSFNLAFGYQKPLLMHSYYERYPDFKENGLFYNLENFSSFLASLPAALKAENSFYSNPKWTLKSQTDHYIDFLKQ